MPKNRIFKIRPTDKPIPISDKINKNNLNPSIWLISGTLITGNKNAVIAILTTILACKGIELLEKKGALIKKDEINFQKKKIVNFDENQAEILTSRFIQKITTQFVKHLKDEETSVAESIEVIQKVFQS